MRTKHNAIDGTFDSFRHPDFERVRRAYMLSGRYFEVRRR